MRPDRPFLEELQHELELWQRQRLIGSDHARRILAHYGLAPQVAEEVGSRGRLAAVVGVLGAILAGIGVILFVASNWQDLDRQQKVALLLAALLAAYFVGYWLQYERGDFPRIGGAFILLGSILFGTNIFLTAQTYHVPANEPLLLASWSAGAFAVAYVTASRPSTYLALLVAVAWYGFQLVAWRAHTLGAAGITGFAAFLAYGFLLLSAGEVQRSFCRTKPFSTAFVNLGLVVGLAALLVFSFADFWKFQGTSPSAGTNAESAVAQLNISFAVFATLAPVLALCAAWRLGLTRSSLLQAAGVLALVASGLVVVFHPFQDPKVYAIIFNVALLATVVWVIVVGLWTRRESLINIGLAFFVLVVSARYFDFFFSFVDRSLAFISAGALLLGGGYLLERSRRRLLETMHAEEVQSHAN